MVEPPYNNRFNLIRRGRHGFCAGRSKMWVLRQNPRRSVERPSASQAGAQPTASQVNRALYGRNKGPCGTKTIGCGEKEVEISQANAPRLDED